MKLETNIQKIKRGKKLKRHQELREIASPLHPKRNMRKEKHIILAKSPPTLKQNQLDDRKGEEATKRTTELLIVSPESTQIQPVEESGEASSDLNIVEEHFSRGRIGNHTH